MFYSDEELEDSKALLYLPIAPEVEDPEENPYGPPPDAVQSSLTDEGMGSEKKRQSSSDGPQAPKKKPKTTNIELQGVPNDGVYKLPLIQHQFCIWDGFFWLCSVQRQKVQKFTLSYEVNNYNSY